MPRPDDFMQGIELESLIAADLNAEYTAAMDRAVGEMLGDLSNWKPTGLLSALGGDDA